MQDLQGTAAEYRPSDVRRSELEHSAAREPDAPSKRVGSEPYRRQWVRVRSSAGRQLTGAGVGPVRFSSGETSLARFHRLMHWSLPAVTIERPSGEKAADQTRPQCPVITEHSLPVVRSLSCIVPSFPVETRVFPSGENAIVETPAAGPSRLGNTRFPRRSQRMIRLEDIAEAASVWPS